MQLDYWLLIKKFPLWNLHLLDLKYLPVDDLIKISEHFQPIYDLFCSVFDPDDKDHYYPWFSGIYGRLNKFGIIRQNAPIHKDDSFVIQYITFSEVRFSQFNIEDHFICTYCYYNNGMSYISKERAIENINKNLKRDIDDYNNNCKAK